jgi:formate-dependent nitrite reductase membrane component NrfD
MSTPDCVAPRPQAGVSANKVARSFEIALYSVAFVLLAAAAVLVAIGGVQAVIQSVTQRATTLEGAVLVLDHALLILIVAELAYTIRSVQYHEIRVEPFLFIGLIATIRRILIVTAELEHPQTDQALNRLLLQLGALGLLVLAIAAAIFMVRYSASPVSAGDHPTAGGQEPSS